MAAVDFALAVQLTDKDQVPAPLLIDAVSSSGLLADMQAFSGTFLTALDAADASQITAAEIVVPLDISGYKAAPVAGFGNGYGGKLRYNTASIGDKKTYWIPNLLAACYVPGHPTLIDFVDAGVGKTLFDLFLAVTSTVNLTDGDKHALTAVISGLKTERKFRRALARKK